MDARAVIHAVEAEAALARRRIEADAVIPHHQPDRVVDDVTADPDVARLAVAGRVPDRLLDDPVEVDLHLGFEIARGQKRGIEAQLDRDAGRAREVVERGAEPDLVDARGTQLGRDLAGLRQG